MTYRTLEAVLTVSTLCLIAACATSGETVAARGVPQDLITREMIDESPHERASDLVRALRPRWFQRAGPARLGGGGRTQIQVYVDGTGRGGPESLNAIASSSIEQIRFLSPADATTTFGTGHAAGAIVIVTRRN